MYPVYRVSFYKCLEDSTGHPFEPCQGVVDVHAPNPERAVESARILFAINKGVGDWTMRADNAKAELLVGRMRLHHAQAVHRA